MADACRGCAKPAVRPFFDLGDMPLAGGFLDGPEAIASEQRYPLLASVSDHCGLVQIVDPVDPSVLFSDYSFKTGTIPGLVRHFDGYAEWIAELWSALLGPDEARDLMRASNEPAESSLRVNTLVSSATSTLLSAASKCARSAGTTPSGL